MLEPEIHPKLKKTSRFLKYGLPVLMLVLWAILAVGYYLDYHSAIPSIVIGALVFAGAIYMRSSFLRRIKRASGLMAVSQGRPVSFTNTRARDHRGLYLELRPPNADQAAPASVVAVVEENRFQPIPKEPTEALMFRDRTEPKDGFLVLETRDRVYLGRLTTREDRASARRKFKLMLAAIFAGFVVLVSWICYDQYELIQEKKGLLTAAQASLDWPRTPGEIVASEIRDVRIRLGRIMVDGYQAEIEYEYNVSNLLHRGDSIFFGYKPGRNRARAEELVDKYPVGSRPEIAYDPRRPEFSILEPGHVEECRRMLEKAKKGLTAALIGGSAAVILSLIGLIIFLSWNFKRMPKD